MILQGGTTKAGDVGPEDLPSQMKVDMSSCELETFLQEHGLQPCGPAATLKDRAWRLRDALSKQGFLGDKLRQGQLVELK